MPIGNSHAKNDFARIHAAPREPSNPNNRNEISSCRSTLEFPSRSAVEMAAADANPGTIYLGRIPHGFYEHQMRSYFSQFGTIKRLRLSRNKHTGASKHYAFIEFESAEVADIVARTMDKYLLFGHILQVRVVPPEQVHKDLWKGAGRRFKKIPWSKLQGKNLRDPKTRDVWRRRITKEEERRKAKAEKLKDFDYEFDMPGLKQVDDVAARNANGASEEANIEDTQQGSEEVPKTIEATPADEEITVDTLLQKNLPDGAAATVKIKSKKSRKKAKAI